MSWWYNPEFDKLSEKTFTMTVLPYFTEYWCQECDCEEKARYYCQYELTTNLKKELYLCKKHEKQDFLNFSYVHKYNYVD